MRTTLLTKLLHFTYDYATKLKKSIQLGVIFTILLQSELLLVMFIKTAVLKNFNKSF